MIFLAGAPASGKTTLGRRLAERLGLDFVDLDAEIVAAAGCSIPEIFAARGEPAFRDIESETLASVVHGRDASSVVALGGGVTGDLTGLASALYMRGMGLSPFAITSPDDRLRLLFAAPHDLLLTFVGELSYRKNQIFLVRAVARLREEGLPVRLLLVGEGSERKKLIRTIGKLGLSGAVFLVGNREPVLPYLAVTDLYVSASRSEGLPFNILEAMQCGLPVIASRVRGQEDLLSDNSLYPLDDMDAFCAAVRRYSEGARGVSSVSYPNLGKYLLPAVFEENLKILRSGVDS